MAALKPYLPKEAVGYQGPGGRILIINPMSYRWTITDALGVKILTACNGKRSIGEVAETAGVPVVNKKEFRVMIHRLIKEEILFFDVKGYSGNRPPCDAKGLRSLHLEVTNLCNLRCSHCYLSAGKLGRSELAFGEICKVVEDFASTIPPGESGRIGITGGEARLRPDYLNIVAFCCEKGLDTVLFTNAVGWRVTDVERLAESGAEIQVSLDGLDPHTNDAIRGEGTFREIMRGIDLFLSYGFGPRITLFLTLTKQNIGNAIKMVSFAQQRGIGFVHFSQINSQGRATTFWRDLAPSPAQWVAFGRQFLAQTNKRVHIKGNVFGGLYMSPDFFPHVPCALPSSPRIDCRGNVYPCQLFVSSRFRIGNIRNRSLGEILDGPSAHLLAQKCTSRSCCITRCRMCKWRALCNSGCAGHAYSEFGTLNREDSFCAVRLYWFEMQARKILGISRQPLPAE
jgi:radical SAM protein with 4Fe4S-binding SPASM domain